MNDDFEYDESGMIANNLRAVYALDNGWKVIPNARGRQHTSDHYERGSVHVWRISTGWRVALLKNDRYTEHRTVDTFVEAMATPKVWS